MRTSNLCSNEESPESQGPLHQAVELPSLPPHSPPEEGRKELSRLASLQDALLDLYSPSFNAYLLQLMSRGRGEEESSRWNLAFCLPDSRLPSKRCGKGPGRRHCLPAVSYPCRYRYHCLIRVGDATHRQRNFHRVRRHWVGYHRQSWPYNSRLYIIYIFYLSNCKFTDSTASSGFIILLILCSRLSLQTVTL